MEGRVAERNDGLREIFRLLNDPDPDLLLVDLLDEGAGGDALLSFIAEQPELAWIPLVVVINGAEPTGVAAHAAHLVKPFDVDALRTAVVKTMAGRSDRPAPEPHQHPGT